jgi:hypothetical protein
MSVSLNLLVRYFGILKSLSFLKLYLDVTLGGSKLRSLCSSSFKIETKSLLHIDHPFLHIKSLDLTCLERPDRIVQGKLYVALSHNGRPDMHIPISTLLKRHKALPITSVKSKPFKLFQQI